MKDYAIQINDIELSKKIIAPKKGTTPLYTSVLVMEPVLVSINSQDTSGLNKYISTANVAFGLMNGNEQIARVVRTGIIGQGYNDIITDVDDSQKNTCIETLKSFVETEYL